MNSLDRVKTICKTIGGLVPDPVIKEDEWAEWLEHWKGFPEVIDCPQCDGRLAEKSGKYGAFVGCSNYPDCTFTRKVGQ